MHHQLGWTLADRSRAVVFFCRSIAMLGLIKTLLKSLPIVKGQIARYHAWKRRIRPGHFYSPVPSAEEIARLSVGLFEPARREFPGINLAEEAQLDLLARLAPFYADQPFHEAPTAGLRYYFGNDYFSYGDALMLYSLMRFARPQRIIEVGSVYSSFVMLDTNERFFDRRIQLTFIEPNPERLQSRLTPADAASAEIVTQPVQQFPVSRFRELEAGDILFIDSSHVSKLGSDLNHLLLEVVPQLASGVYVHFHDIFYPFEYPAEWFADCRFWNEAYLLRAFLTNNAQFEICAWLDFLGTFHTPALAAALPLACTNVARTCPAHLAPSGSFWIRKR
jgi:hypothetical protein